MLAARMAVESSRVTGAAGEPWSSWQPTPGEIGDRPAPMLRVGVHDTLQYEPLALQGGLGERHTALPYTQQGVNEARGLLLRMLGDAAPGTVRVTVFDGSLTGTFKDFAGLGKHLYTNAGPGTLKGLVSAERDYQHMLATTDTEVGDLANPWHVLVMVGDGGELRQKTDLDELNRLIGGGTGWGSVIALGVDGLEGGRLLQRGVHRRLKYTSDGLVPTELVAATTADIAAKAADARLSPPMESLLRGEMWTRPAEKGLEAQIGLSAGRPVTIRVGDKTAHAIAVGPNNSGKTNLFRQALAELCYGHDPRDLHIYAVDYKGPGLAGFGPNGNDGTYFPHFRVIGNNVEDPEAGIAVLRHLKEEVDRRKQAQVDMGVEDITQMMQEDPGNWPRILGVFDELQLQLNGPMGGEAVELLEYIVRMGRSLGVHIWAGTQTFSGIQKMWAHQKAILEQFTLRMGMPGASGVMDPVTNAEVTKHLPEHHAVVNDQHGTREGNVIVHLPHVTQRALRALKERIWERSRADWTPPMVIDGRVRPSLARAKAFVEAAPRDRQPAVALVGQDFAVTDKSAGFSFDRTPGRNLAVLGTREIAEVMGSSARSVAKQHAPGTARFTILSLNDSLYEDAKQLAIELGATDNEVQFVDGLTDSTLAVASAAVDAKDGGGSKRHYIIAYGADSLRTKQFQELMDQGPQAGIHVIGSWSNPERLKESLGGMSAKMGSVGGYVALDVNGSELGQLTPALRLSGGPKWAPNRQHRGLFYDSRASAAPRAVILYS